MRPALGIFPKGSRNPGAHHPAPSFGGNLKSGSPLPTTLC
jgi:hypothetical protein